MPTLELASGTIKRELQEIGGRWWKTQAERSLDRPLIRQPITNDHAMLVYRGFRSKGDSNAAEAVLTCWDNGSPGESLLFGHPKTEMGGGWPPNTQSALPMSSRAFAPTDAVYLPLLSKEVVKTKFVVPVLLNTLFFVVAG